MVNRNRYEPKVLTSEGGRVGAGQSPPEREPAAYNHDNRADQGCHKAVDTLKGQIDQDCNAKNHANYADDLHTFSSLSYPMIPYWEALA